MQFENCHSNSQLDFYQVNNEIRTSFSLVVVVVVEVSTSKFKFDRYVAPTKLTMASFFVYLFFFRDKQLDGILINLDIQMYILEWKRICRINTLS